MKKYIIERPPYANSLTNDMGDCMKVSAKSKKQAFKKVRDAGMFAQIFTFEYWKNVRSMGVFNGTLSITRVASLLLFILVTSGTQGQDAESVAQWLPGDSVVKVTYYVRIDRDTIKLRQREDYFKYDSVLVQTSDTTTGKQEQLFRYDIENSQLLGEAEQWIENRSDAFDRRIAELQDEISQLRLRKGDFRVLAKKLTQIARNKSKILDDPTSDPAYLEIALEKRKGDEANFNQFKKSELIKYIINN